MAKKEVKTDLWVYELLKEAGIKLSAQGCEIKEIDEALKTASKSKTGNAGYPEYCGVVKDFILVIEDKPTLDKHIFFNEKNVIDTDNVTAIKDYAVNGALHYAYHLINNTSYKKVIGFGVSGSEKRHKITPFFLNERSDLYSLNDVETFISFNEENIDEYYRCEILQEPTDVEKTTEEILKDASILHEDLRSYGQLTTEQKPLIVSGIMLALREIEYKNFSIDNLVGDTTITDGQKIYDAIRANLNRANVTPDTKRDKLLSQFSVIKDNTKINTIEETLKKTPLRHYTEFLYKSIFKNIKYTNSSEDYLGRFYGEFMSYSGGDGQSLGIVLTPKHITELFCDLANIKPTDKVFDPCCGTAGFLIASMHKMVKLAGDDEVQIRRIKKEQLFGIELQAYMYTIATTNMILRGDGNSNLHNWDFLKQNPAQLQLKGYTVGMMNPPYSQGTKADPSLYEINFTEHLLDSLTEGAKAVVIIPQSSVTGKTKEEQAIKENILKNHTLEGVITLHKDTFYGVGVNTCIAVFTAHIPHNKKHICKFINFEDDGFVVAKHVGLVETQSAKDKRQHLLDVWFDRTEAETKFCVKTTIEAEDEWLHSFYYFNDEIPSEKDFENTMADYLTFEFNMMTHGRGYLFDEKGGYDGKAN
ncbi:MAG: class I SAM-dependent DNA methyltransferase [Bacteroides xylanisolvens]